jgi:hypothetical protein
MGASPVRRNCGCIGSIVGIPYKIAGQFAERLAFVLHVLFLTSVINVSRGQVTLCSLENFAAQDAGL